MPLHELGWDYVAVIEKYLELLDLWCRSKARHARCGPGLRSHVRDVVRSLHLA